jgi:glycerol-3-phosphate dehydrogenase
MPCCISLGRKDWRSGFARHHVTQAGALISTSCKLPDLGWNFDGGLYAAEVNWMMSREFALKREDILQRWTKYGLRLTRRERRRFVIICREGAPGDH